MFSLDVLWMGLYLVAAVAVPVGYFLVGRRRDVAVAAVLIVVFFATAVTFLDNPVLALAALGAALGTLVMIAPLRLRLPPWLAVSTLIIAILLIVWYYDQPSLWLNFYDKIPGGIGIRAVGRVVLFLLIPAALGLAMLVQFLEHRQWTMAASILVLVCILEQGVTTESVDAAEGRANVASLVRQVDPRQGGVLLWSRAKPSSVHLSIWTPCGRRWRPGCPRSTAIPVTIHQAGKVSSQSMPFLLWTLGRFLPHGNKLKVSARANSEHRDGSGSRRLVRDLDSTGGERLGRTSREDYAQDSELPGLLNPVYLMHR